MMLGYEFILTLVDDSQIRVKPEDFTRWSDMRVRVKDRIYEKHEWRTVEAKDTWR